MHIKLYRLNCLRLFYTVDFLNGLNCVSLIHSNMLFLVSYHNYIVRLIWTINIAENTLDRMDSLPNWTETAKGECTFIAVCLSRPKQSLLALGQLANGCSQEKTLFLRLASSAWPVGQGEWMSLLIEVNAWRTRRCNRDSIAGECKIIHSFICNRRIGFRRFRFSKRRMPKKLAYQLIIRCLKVYFL